MLYEDSRGTQIKKGVKKRSKRAERRGTFFIWLRKMRSWERRNKKEMWVAMDEDGGVAS